MIRISEFGGGKSLDVDYLKQTIAAFLGAQKNDAIIDALLARASDYIDATGDRNVRKGTPRTKDFYLQGNNPSAILNAIKAAGGFK